MKQALLIRNWTLYLLIVGGLIVGATALNMVGCDTANAEEGYATYFTVASCKAEGNSGIMASGVPLDDDSRVCALPITGKPDGRWYMVQNVFKPEMYSLVRWMDKGPGMGPRKHGVVIDLSKRAFEDVCGDTRQGKCWVGYMAVVE